MPGAILLSNPAIAFIVGITLIVMTVSHDPGKKDNSVAGESEFMQLLKPLLHYFYTTISGKAQNVWTFISSLLEMILPYFGNFISAVIGGYVSYAIQSKSLEKKIESDMSQFRKGGNPNRY